MVGAASAAVAVMPPGEAMAQLLLRSPGGGASLQLVSRCQAAIAGRGCRMTMMESHVAAEGLGALRSPVRIGARAALAVEGWSVAQAYGTTPSRPRLHPPYPATQSYEISGAQEEWRREAW